MQTGRLTSMSTIPVYFYVQPLVSVYLLKCMCFFNATKDDQKVLRVCLLVCSGERAYVYVYVDVNVMCCWIYRLHLCIYNLVFMCFSDAICYLQSVREDGW